MLNIKFNTAFIYYLASSYFLLCFLSSCQEKRIVPAFEIVESEKGLLKTYFTEEGERLLEVNLDIDSFYVGRYRLFLNKSDLIAEVMIDSGLINGNYHLIDSEERVIKKGSFYRGEKHHSWTFHQVIDDSFRIVQEQNFYRGLSFGRHIQYDSNVDDYKLFLVVYGDTIGKGSGNKDVFFYESGYLNFHEYRSLEGSLEVMDLQLFVVDVPNKQIRLSILDEKDGEPHLVEVFPDGFKNGMWYFRGDQLRNKSSLKVKMLDLKIVDDYERDVYRDFITLPIVF